MITKAFKELQLSALGFGTMRLPLLENGEIDQQQVQQMTDMAIANGVNYFDTAWPYHDGKSELAIGKALSAHPRDSYYLATKFPGHQISASYDPAGVFEAQLQKCGVTYFDFYLLHNVYENSFATYTDSRWNILAYFREQKRLGRIKHLGFSTHGRAPFLREFLEGEGKDMEFCQIQLNWLDWTLQDAEAVVALLQEKQLPIWVMEPLRGGKLCQLEEKAVTSLKALRPEETVPGWSFRFLQSIPGVTMVLSGMSDLRQMEENIRTFTTEAPLNADEQQLLQTIAEDMKQAVPCTGCRYCTEHCPMGLDIPTLIAAYNELVCAYSISLTMRMETIPPEKQPGACIGCGACAAICPQRIAVPDIMADFAARLEKMPTWTEICRQREEAAKKLQK